MPASVRFRLPGQTHIHEISTQQTPLQCASLEEIPPTEGYLFAPFVADARHPLWFIPADETRSWPQLTDVEGINLAFTAMDAPGRSDYSRAFSACQTALHQGDVEKIVLSRTLSLKFDAPLTDQAKHRLFERACLSYPQSFISLVSLPDPWGTWLMATPEILLTADTDAWHTMALAGTMEQTDAAPRVADEWSDKDRREQRWVVDYISNQLAHLGCDFHTSATYVRPAGALLHLCTDFTISIPHSSSQKTEHSPKGSEISRKVSEHFNKNSAPSGKSPEPPTMHSVISALHPTPAVCGWPATTAKTLIAQIEPHDRSYYSGYSGPISPTAAQLYVTLRCMHLHDDAATLYAGGGLLKESNENSEWQETERKLGTMLRLFSAP